MTTCSGRMTSSMADVHRYRSEEKMTCCLSLTGETKEEAAWDLASRTWSRLSCYVAFKKLHEYKGSSG